MATSEERNPAEARVVWLYAEASTKPLYDSERVGKWNLFIPRSAVNRVWEVLAAATERGELGISAKVSGALSKPDAHDPNSHVVIIYAADWRDVKDLRRILRRLRDFGIERSIYFKRDRETLAGRYSEKSKPTVSVWGSPSGDMVRTKWVGNGKTWVDVTAETQEGIVAQIEVLDEGDSTSL